MIISLLSILIIIIIATGYSFFKIKFSLITRVLLSLSFPPLILLLIILLHQYSILSIPDYYQCIIIFFSLIIPLWFFLFQPLLRSNKELLISNDIFSSSFQDNKEVIEVLENNPSNQNLVNLSDSVERIYESLDTQKQILEGTEKFIKNVSNKLSMVVKSTTGDGALSLFDKTIEIMYSLDKSIEKTINEMKNQSITLQMTFEAFDVSTMSMERVDEVTKLAKSLAESLSSRANDGAKSVDFTSKAIDQISQSSESMAEIVATITEISEKTNLLAINAAIEAARAGIKGKGFAIVAHEVRKLAQNTHNSTFEIKKIIQQISERIKHGVSSINSTKAIFTEILIDIEQTNTLNQEVYEISRKNVIQGKEIVTAVMLLKSIASRIINASSDELFETNEVVIALNEVHALIQQVYKTFVEGLSLAEKNFSIVQENILAIEKIREKLLLCSGSDFNTSSS